ncbi:solute carrier organic anion transporter family member 5A1-like [Tropilaelaps mercedesae]|uniref:Solute carrier organic anion transporter family member 5A1-like n=1 Tax=Tropilaelaps mercedesae TaxID=418985 RepID=A0A1V9XXC7_9ACAR|nr:solute carrier organic anion transporter family member 5A1-like [Tropilaelaps mercedesae]
MDKSDCQRVDSQTSLSVPSSGISATKSTTILYSDKTKYAEDVYPEKDYLCGVFSFRPQFLQRFAHPRWYFVNYVMMGILSGAYKTYLVGTLSTVERRFQMSNSTTAIILIADNISPIFINVLAGYYANRISRPKLMSLDMARASVEQKIRLCHNSSLENLSDENRCNENDGI